MRCFKLNTRVSDAFADMTSSKLGELAHSLKSEDLAVAAWKIGEEPRNLARDYKLPKLIYF